MKPPNMTLFVLMSLVIHACIPTIPTPTPSYTSTSVSFTETPPSIETPTTTSTPVSTFTETAAPTPTETTTPTFTPSSTFTQTATSTSTDTSTATSVSPGPLTIPAASDWDTGSLAFSHGAEGEWDHILWGGFANSLIKKGDTYYLYYQGSSFYDDSCESVAHRAIGVATSKDGVHWTKSARNPVISWSSQGSIEEGAVSSAAWVGEDGRIYVYYGANTGSGCHINASARLAVSEDGETFQDIGEVLSGGDPNIWGYGDEVFPIGAYSYNNQWYLYYTPNGVSLARKLGVAVGNSPTIFTQTTGVNNSTIPAWGPVSIILDGANSVLITNFNNAGTKTMYIYRFDAADPSVVQPYDSYSLPGCSPTSVIYESSTHHWMLSCLDQDADNYYIRHAYTP